MASQNADVGLLEDEPLFRVISFYEIISIIEKNTLRFARMDTMDDPNEAITSVLDSELGAAFVGSEFNPHEKLTSGIILTSVQPLSVVGRASLKISRCGQFTLPIKIG